jgi:hypothetical protein
MLNKIAGKNECFRVIRNNFELDGTGGLSPRERRYLHFFISLAKLGYGTVAVSMDTLAAAIYQAQGQTRSVRTLRTALAELETAGYLTRRKYRIGEDHFRTVIVLNPDRFAYWTQVKTAKVIPLPTSSHVSSYRQDLPESDRRINPTVQTDSSSDNLRFEQRARSNFNTKKHRYHPVIYTLMVILKGQDRFPLLTLADSEVRGGDNLSGVDWDYWSRVWPKLSASPGGERERTAKREIVPLLLAAIGKGPAVSPVVPKNLVTSPPAEQPCDIIPASREEVRTLLRDLVTVIPPPTTQNHEPSRDASPNTLSDEEMAVLLPAKEAIENRRKWVV